jgi:hypothetical protein
MSAVPGPLAILAHDEFLADLIGPVEQWVAAIRADDAVMLNDAWRAATDAAGGSGRLRGMAGIAMMLGAACIDDRLNLADRLRWVADKDTYRQALEEGFTHSEAVHWTLHTLERDTEPPAAQDERRLRIVRPAGG